MCNRNTGQDAVDLLDHVAARFEVKYRLRQPLRTYVIAANGEPEPDLKELARRLDRLINNLPRNYSD